MHLKGVLILTLMVVVHLFSCKPAQKVSLVDAVSVPFELSAYNNIIFDVVLNDTDSLKLKFDSGATGLLLTHDAIKNKTQLLKSGKEKTPTQNYVKLNTLSSIRLGSLSWDSLEIYPVRHSGHGTDGRFGWDLFEDKVLEINYDNNQMTIHDKLPNVETYSKIKLDRVKTLWCFDGTILAKGKDYSGRFLFDTGYQKAMLLDSIMMQEQQFPKDLPLIKTNRLRNGAGQVFITKVVKVPSLKIGALELQNIPTQLLNTRNPAGFKTHILGNELLKRWNTIIDFKNQTIYFKPNQLLNDAYSDMKKKE